MGDQRQQLARDGVASTEAQHRRVAQETAQVRRFYTQLAAQHQRDREQHQDEQKRLRAELSEMRLQSVR